MAKGKVTEFLKGLERGAKSVSRRATNETRIESFMGGKRHLPPVNKTLRMNIDYVLTVGSPFLFFILYF